VSTTRGCAYRETLGLLTTSNCARSDPLRTCCLMAILAGPVIERLYGFRHLALRCHCHQEAPGFQAILLILPIVADQVRYTSRR
jgi:hypothetical protein